MHVMKRIAPMVLGVVLAALAAVFAQNREQSQIYADHPMLQGLSDDARLVVSEPLGDLRGVWREVPESTCLTIRGGDEKAEPFTPINPRAAA